MIYDAATAASRFRSKHHNTAGYLIGGKIREQYNRASQTNGMTGAEFFGDAITKAADASRGGRPQEFYKNSSIYWHPRVSNGHANQIGGSIRDKRLALGYEEAALRSVRPASFARSAAALSPAQWGT